MNDIKKPLTTGESLDQLLSQGNVRQRAVNALQEALGSMRTYWSSIEKAMVTEPDHRTRVTAAELLLAYCDGRPIERKEVVTHNLETGEDMLRRAKASPAFAREIARLHAELIGSKPIEVADSADSSAKV